MGAGVGNAGGGSGRRGRHRGSRSAAMHEINITPMVDVMLVLLIIFMVAAPMLTVGVPIELPETAANALPAEQEEPLAITMTADGKLLIQTTETAPEELISRLSAIAAERGLAVERLSAVDGRAAGALDGAAVRAGAPLTPPEVACFESHRLAWARIAAGRPMIRSA